VVLSDNPEHTLTIHQIHTSSSHLTINFQSYKHSKNHKPKVIVPSIPNSTYCPVLAFQSYLSQRSPSPGPVFLNQNGSPITRLQFAQFLKLTLSMAGLPGEHFNTHSFRIGRTTQMAQDNHSEHTIRTAGRWQSDAYKGYIRSNDIVLPQ
jgi:site-specific recombinase XerD